MHVDDVERNLVEEVFVSFDKEEYFPLVDTNFAAYAATYAVLKRTTSESGVVFVSWKLRCWWGTKAMDIHSNTVTSRGKSFPPIEKVLKDLGWKMN